MWMRCKLLSQCCRLGISGVILRILVLSCITFFLLHDSNEGKFLLQNLSSEESSQSLVGIL